MKTNPFFSIIIPVFNRQDCIERCISSVLHQEFTNYELILINDGSTDNTLRSIKQSLSGDLRLNLITYTENKGVNYARNRGIQKACGDFIIFLDSDDYFLNNSLTKIFNNIKLNPNYSHYLFLNDDGRKDKFHPTDIVETSYLNWLSEKASGDFVHVVQTQILNNNLFDENFRIYEILNWLRIYKIGENQLLIPEFITKVELNRPDSITHESLLDNKTNIINTYNFLNQFITMYAEDFKLYNISNQLQGKIKKAIILGFALGETARNEKLINQMSATSVERKLFKVLNCKRLNPIFYRLTQLKSLIGQWRRKLS